MPARQSGLPVPAVGSGYPAIILASTCSAANGADAISSGIPAEWPTKSVAKSLLESAFRKEPRSWRAFAKLHRYAGGKMVDAQGTNPGPAHGRLTRCAARAERAFGALTSTRWASC